jgi:two-component system sensor kinase FixL
MASRRLGRPIRALIVASESTADRLEPLLNDVGEPLFEVSRVQDPDEAAATLRAQPLDVILLAIDTDGDGADPLVALSHLQQAAPVAAHILVGNARHERSGLAAIRHGAEDYLLLEQTDAQLAKRTIRFAMERKAVRNGLQATHNALQRRIDEQIFQCRTITDELDRESLSRRDAETRLAREHELNGAILRHAGVLVLVLDEESQIIHFNPECERLTGIEAASAEHRPLTEVVPGLAPAALDSLYDALRIRGEAVVNREQWPVQGGRSRLIEWTNTAVGASASGRGMMVRIGVDVTSREAMQEALRESEHRLRLITDALPALIAYVDGTGRYRFANGAHREWLGVDTDQICGRHFTDVWPEEAADILVPRIDRLYRELCRQDFNVTLPSLSDGKERDVSATLVPERSAPGERGGFYALFHDVTEHRRVRQRERECTRELAHINRITTLDGMSAPIIHELKQPLAAVSAYATTCLRLLPTSGVEGRDLREALTALSGQVQRAGDIVQRLCRFARNSDGVQSPVELNTTVNGVLNLIGSEADLSDIDVHLDLDKRSPAVLADPVLMQQVLLNLVRNALDAVVEVPKSRRISLQTRLNENDTVSLRVLDTGPGLPPHVAEHMFDPFYTTKADGMGVGLSISRTIIEAHGGRLWAEANGGDGAMLSIELPAHPHR